MAGLLQIKFFSNASWQQMETDVNAFLTQNKLITENYIDLVYAPVGQGNKDVIYSAVLIYRK